MTITHQTATQPGGLDHYAATCPQCGMVLTNTIEANLALDAEQHLAWHESQR